MSLITIAAATDMISVYKTDRPNMLVAGWPNETLPLNITFEKDEIQALLDQDGCVKMRVYFGLKPIETEQGEDKGIDLVLVGVDEKDEDIIPNQDYILIDQGQRCPSVCPPQSIINS
jgi:hypothetical protein